MSYQGSEFDSRVVLAQEAKISSLTKSELKTVGTTAVLLDLSTGEPTGEMTIFLQGGYLNADVIFIGYSNAVSSTNYAFTLDPKEKIGLTLNSENPPTIYAIATVANEKIAVTKGL